MTDKNEVLELAKKWADTDTVNLYRFSERGLLGYVAALEEKHQAQIAELEGKVAMLRSRIVRLHEKFTSGPPYTWTMATVIVECEGAISATQQSSEAFLAEVRAKAKLEGKIEALKDAAEQWRDEWGANELQTMAAELRTSAAKPEGKEVK